MLQNGVGWITSSWMRGIGLALSGTPFRRCWRLPVAPAVVPIVPAVAPVIPVVPRLAEIEIAPGPPEAKAQAKAIAPAVMPGQALVARALGLRLRARYGRHGLADRGEPLRDALLLRPCRLLAGRG